MIAPTLSLHGTSREKLLDQATAASEALLEAARVLNEMWPHGRDYPTTEAYFAATSAHARRITLLTEMHAEMMGYAECVANAPGPTNPRDA